MQAKVKYMVSIFLLDFCIICKSSIGIAMYLLAGISEKKLMDNKY